jgi:lipid A 4'-phosphatase
MGRGLAAYAAASALAVVLFLLFPGIDLWASGLFYRRGVGFFLGGWGPVRAIYEAVPYLVYLIVAGVALLFALALWRGTPGRTDVRVAIYLLLSLGLGPGLLVNTALKDHWGRARPIQVSEFGGVQAFTPAPLPTDECQRNCSFPAGHPAMGFYLVSFAFLVQEPRRRRLAEGAAIATGTLIGVARMAQGGHFLSDVVYSGFLVYGTSWLLYRAVIVRDALAPLLRFPTFSLVGLGAGVGVVLSMAFLDRPLAVFFHGVDPDTHAVFAFITRFGLSKGYLIASAGLFVALRVAAALVREPGLGARLARNAYRALFVFAVVAISGLAADLLKLGFGRARPKLLFDSGIYGFTWGATKADYWSFPSGHAVTIAAVATALFLLWPRALAACVAAALLVMASRVILAAHYLSDVIVGAGFGMAVAWATWIVFQRTGTALTSEARASLPKAGARSFSDSP